MKRLIKAGVLTLILVLSMFAPAAAAETKSAYPSATKLLLGSELKNVNAYNISGYNYYKLRDLAVLLKDTEKSFSVSYDGNTKKILIKTNEKYSGDDGTQEKISSSASVKATESSVAISCDGQDVTGVSVYNIEGYNFFKLRDVAKMINLGLGYDEETKIIMLSPSSGYVNITDAKFPLYDVGCFHMEEGYCGIYFSESEGTKGFIKDIEVVGVTISLDNSKMEAHPFREVPQDVISKVSESLKLEAVEGIYVDYPFKLGTYMEIRVYAKLSDNSGNTENHCYILTGNIDKYWDMYPDN